MAPKIGRRRSPRIAEERPIEVTGTTVDGVDFLSHSRTILLSRYGAKIHLDQPLALEQEISIYHPESKRECLAKVVGLYDQESGGYSYGVEFLDPKLDFWNLGFPGAAEPGAAQTEEPAAAVAAPASRKAASATTHPGPRVAEEPPRPAARHAPPPPAGNDYAVQMKCPHGAEEQWVLLRNRTESLQEILNKPWDFPCPIHGLQRELPLQVREVQEWLQSEAERKNSETSPRAGVLPLEAQLRKRQGESRSPQAVRVWVSGSDPNGNPFSQSAYSLDISRSGARLDGVGFVTEPGMILEVKRGWKKAKFRVVWVGEFGTERAGQVGIRCLEPDKNIWGLR